MRHAARALILFFFGLVFFMRRVIGYMLTWTTYGTWLQGDERGYVKDSETFRGNAGLLRANLESQKGNTVRLDGAQKEIVRCAICEEARRLGQRIFALAVWSNHVHLVADNIDEAVGTVAGRYKRAARWALKREGFEENVWTKGYDKRFCFDDEELRGRIEYVEGHGD